LLALYLPLLLEVLSTYAQIGQTKRLSMRSTFAPVRRALRTAASPTALQLQGRIGTTAFPPKAAIAATNYCN